jgi:hypothetical protein
LTIVLLTISCDNKAGQQNDNSSSSDSMTLTISTIDKKDTVSVSMTKPNFKSVGEFQIEYGYLKYDEDEFGFSNPGYMRVFKGDQLVFEDSFNGEGPVDVESFDLQELAGQKLVFRLNHGTEACDYTLHSRYYVLIDSKIYFLKDCYASTGGDQYASRFYEHILPKDSAGVDNSILIVEGLIFHEHDQQDRFDTTFIKFADNKFILSKPTNNLDKVK